MENMIGKIRCGGVMEKDSLCLIEVMGYDWRPGQACGILGIFADMGLALSFVSVVESADGKRNMALCLDRSFLEKARENLQEIEAQLNPSRIAVSEDVTILTLYGPHFHEKRGVASSAYAAFCGAAINTLAVCSSVNSISFVIASSETRSARQCLKRTFDWPD